MPAGFQVIGSHGYLQIDGEFRNFAFAGKGTVNLATESGLPSASLTITASKPILCIKSPSAYVAILSVVTSGNTHTFNIRGSASAAVDWYLFDEMPQTVADHGAGIVVYGADGSVVFNSEYDMMRIAGVAAVPNGDGSVNPAPGSVTVANGTYAACLSMSRSQMVPHTSPTPAFFYLDGIRTRADGADTAFLVSAFAPPNATGGNPIGGTILLVDVAGL